MKFLQLALVFGFSAMASVASADLSKFDELLAKFEASNQLPLAEGLQGATIGRCFNRHDPDSAMGAALVGLFHAVPGEGGAMDSGTTTFRFDVLTKDDPSAYDKRVASDFDGALDALETSGPDATINDTEFSVRDPDHTRRKMYLKIADGYITEKYTELDSRGRERAETMCYFYQAAR